LQQLLSTETFLTNFNHQADKAIAAIEGRCDQKLAECKEESRKQLIHIQEEHAKLVSIKKI